MSKHNHFRHVTRHSMAKRLMERLEKGPVFSENYGSGSFTVQEAERQVRAWAQSWLLDDARALLARDLKEPA